MMTMQRVAFNFFFKKPRIRLVDYEKDCLLHDKP